MSRFPGCLSFAVVLPAVLLSAPRSSLADPAEFNPDARIAMDMHEASLPW